ncbi:hypothetical protein [Haloferula sp.]|uniref:hypothetical protein n=1 Tax=Haloferula sp. TaxID=2497595 RepID=UPI00329B9B37
MGKITPFCRRNPSTTSGLFSGLLIFVFWLAAPLHACQICLPFPTTSLADHLIDADQVVLARENPDKPFSLIAKEVLKGENTLPEIDLFLDSQSRRLLAGDPERHIVCTRVSTGDSSEWTRVATSNPKLLTIIKEILSKASQWTEKPVERSAYFAPYLGNKDRSIATLAHLEVARAPYSEIRELVDAMPIEQLRAFLNDFRYAEWHALYILLLAQSDDPTDQQRIISAVESNADYSITLQTAAWATAFIELKEIQALEFFDQRYLKDPNRSIDEIRVILAAYSVHGTNGHTHLRDHIIESYRALAEKHPELLPTLTVDLAKWKSWALADQVSAVLTSQAEAFDLESTLQLRSYLREAKGSGKPQDRNGSKTNPIIWIIGALLLLPLTFKFLGAQKARN